MTSMLTTNLSFFLSLQGMLHGYLQVPPGVSMAAIPVDVLNNMKESNEWPENLHL